jgi:bifunctional non-homologous end joining protein LigD
MPTANALSGPSKSQVELMQPMKTDLWCNEGKSDKMYHLQLVPAARGMWSVLAQWGRRGGNMTQDVKVKDVAFDDAFKVYEREIKTRISHHYHVVESGADTIPKMVPVGVGRPLTPIGAAMPELLSEISVDEIGRYVSSNRYWLQQKRDGRRLTVRRDGSKFTGGNKTGGIVPVDTRLSQALGKSGATSFLIDGEIESTGYFVWDIMECGEEDLRDWPYALRYAKLREVLSDLELVKVIPSWSTPKEKERMLLKLAEARAEGVVIKDVQAPYRSGREGQHFKLKFTASASFIVGPKEAKKQKDGKRSIGIWLLDPQGNEVYMASVGVPAKYPLPEFGKIVEVKYLYAYRGGHVVQPKYFGVVRDDVKRKECTTAQLKFKADAEVEEAV